MAGESTAATAARAQWELVGRTANGEFPEALLASGQLGRVRLAGTGLLRYLNALHATPMVALIPFILAGPFHEGFVDTRPCSEALGRVGNAR